MLLLRQNITKPLFSFEHRAKLSRPQAPQGQKMKTRKRTSQGSRSQRPLCRRILGRVILGQRGQLNIHLGQRLVHVVHGFSKTSKAWKTTQRFEDVVVLHVPSPWSWSGPSVTCYGFSHIGDRDRCVEQAFYKHRLVKNLKPKHSLKVTFRYV